MIRMLPIDMVQMRESVSARGAGNYLDLSILERPPDQAEEPQETPGEMQGDANAGVWSNHGGEELSQQASDHNDDNAASAAPAVAAAAPVSVESERVVEHDDGDSSPSKRARVQEQLDHTPLVRAMRFDPQLLDSGAPRGSAQGPLYAAGAHEVPVPDEAEDDLEVHAIIGCLIIVGASWCGCMSLSVMSITACMSSAWRAGVRGDSNSGLWTGKTEFSLKEGWKWKSDEQECHEVTSKKGRKELNENEIKEDRKQGLMAAKMKEWKKLLSSGAIVVHTGKDAERIRRETPRDRFLKSRFVLTEAEPGASPETSDIKARWCIRGYLDPDLLTLDTCAPTLSAEGLALALQLSASMRWRIQIADVEGAFLRGDKLEPGRGRIFIELSRERRRDKCESVTEDERQQMRGVLGGMNWLVSGSRPDLAAWSSLMQQRVNCANVADLIEVNKLVSMAHDGKEAHIWIKSIPADKVQFVMLSDAAWANGKDCCSQAGYMIAACDERLPAGERGEFSILRWRSYKQDRQTHSTLGLAECRWVRAMWCEATCENYELRQDHQWSCNIPVTAVIYCKPVFDHANSPTVAIKDKRMAIEMLLLKEDIGMYNVSLRWMATKQMIVDVLTKKGAQLSLFKKVVRDGWFILVEDEAVLGVTSKKSPASGHVNPGM
ncbi:unnamed protein product [Symbiodinium sp. CCMP2592]|nr:unnamed protein product [Symbiodinium sp. CCMP2592]